MDMEQAEVSTTNTFAIMDLKGAKLVELGTHTIEMALLKQLFDEAAHFSEFRVWTAGKDRIYTSTAQDAYAIRVRDLEGTVLGEYTRPFELRKRSDEDKEDIAGGGLNFRVAGEEINIENKYLDHDPPIDDLKVAGDGRLSCDSMSGDVRLSLPDDQQGSFVAQTLSGEIHSDFGKSSRVSRGPGMMLEHQEGRSGAKIRVETFSGDISIRKY